MSVFNDDFLFIHIPKTAGTSVKEWLWVNLPDAKGQQPGNRPPDPNHDTAGLPIGHVPLRDIERFTGRPIDSFQKIVAIIRDPYRQQLSQWWFWRCRYDEGQRHMHDVGAFRPGVLPWFQFEDWLSDPEASDFHLWYEARFRPDRKQLVSDPGKRFRHFGGYYLYWINDGGRVIPPNVEVVKVEELAERWPEVMAPFVPAGAPPLPCSNTQRKPMPFPAEVYLTDRARGIIRERFRWVYDAGHYEP